MALANKPVMVNDGGYQQTNWNALIDNSINSSGSNKIGGKATSYANYYNNLPEAEVEVNNTYDTNSGNWFYQDNIDKGSYSSKNDYYSSNKSNQSTPQVEQPVYNYGDYYATQPKQEVYTPTTTRTTTSTTQPQQTIVQQPTILEAEPVKENKITPQQQNDILVNTLLQQSASESQDQSKLPVAPNLPLTNMDAMRFGIQQSIDEMNGGSTTPATTNNSPVNEPGIYNWNWRNDRISGLLNNAIANYQTPTNQPVTPNLAYEGLPSSNQQSIWDNIMNLGVRSAEASYPSINDIARPKTDSTSFNQRLWNNLIVNPTQNMANSLLDNLGQKVSSSISAWNDTENLSPEQQQILANAQQIANNREVNANGDAPKTEQSNLSKVIQNGISKIPNALQDPQWLQEKTGGASLADLLMDINPITSPIWLAGVKPSTAIKDFISDTARGAYQGLESLSDLFRQGFDTASNAFGQGIDTADRFARKGLDYATENAIQPALDVIGNTAEKGLDNAVYAATGEHRIADKALYDYMNQTGKSLEDLDDNDYRNIYENTRPQTTRYSFTQKYENKNDQTPVTQPENNQTNLNDLIATPNNYNLQLALKNGDITYRQIYDDYAQRHIPGLYQSYMATGKYDDATARERAIQNARSQAFQRIYDLGYRFDLENPDPYYLLNGNEYVNGDFINNFEKGINNDFYTNGASYADRLFNMASGHIEGRNDQLLDDLMSYSAGNAYANQTKGSNYGTTLNLDPNNPTGMNTALQAAMSGQLTKDQILHMYDSKNSDLIIPEEAKKFFASDPSKAVQQLFLNGGKNAGNTESIEATSEEYAKALQALLDANPALKLMVDNGVLTKDDIAMNFFKDLKATGDNDLESKYKSYGGRGGYNRSYGYSRGGGGGYGGYGSSSGNSASSKNQDDTRIHNIMKNWTF